MQNIKKRLHTATEYHCKIKLVVERGTASKEREGES